MRIFASELGHNYDTYSFAYCLYAQRESSDTLSQIYNQGFLPYTGSPDTHGVAYMTRSARINLDGWKPNSENRRVYSRFSDVSRKIEPVSSFSGSIEEMLSFCSTYFRERHGPTVMPLTRLRHILASGWVTDIATYTLDGKLLGYIWLGRDSQATHFYYSFYDLAHVRQSLGLWLMVDMALNCQELGLQYLYLGTAYGTKGLYKTNFDRLEFWDGSQWVANRSLLRERCRADEKRILTACDRWKEDLSSF
jgi:arginine-tRNA-protein transferase